MKKDLFKSILLLITYAALIIFILLKLDMLLVFSSFIVSLCSPILVGFAIAFILNKPFSFFLRVFFAKKLVGRRLAKGMSILLTYSIFLALVTLLFWIVVPQVLKSTATLVSNFSLYANNLRSYFVFLEAQYNISSSINLDIEKLVTQFAGFLSNFVQGLFPHLFSFTQSIYNVFTTAIFGLIISLYVLADKEHFLNQLRRLNYAYLPTKYAVRIDKISRISDYVFSKYVVGQLTDSFIIGCLCYIGMVILKFDYAVLISVLVAVTNVIPIVGPFIGALPSAFILFMVEPISAVYFLIFVTCLQQFESNVIYPRVVGNSVGLPGLWVFVAVIIGGGMFGVAGMVLALPVLSIIYQLVKIDIEKRETTNKEN